MFVQLLVFTCACVLGAAGELSDYNNIRLLIRQAQDILQDYVLSMDGNVPLLNDTRRHYAEIIHVIFDEAAHADLPDDYYNDYQTNINLSAPFALANPQSVVDEIHKLIKDINNCVHKVVQLIEASAQSDNEAIAEKIKKNYEIYGSSDKVLLATGIFAIELLLNHDEYLEWSEDRSAHNFIITGAEKLELPVMALTNLRKLLYRLGPNDTC